MSEELMTLVEIDLLSRTSGNGRDVMRLVKTARAAHSLKSENENLRAVFEAARRVLRYYGTHDESFVIAMRELDKECEAVKAADAGNGDV